MKKVTASGHIKDGKLELVSRKVFAADVSTLPDGEYDLVLRRTGKLRTNQQNRYYYGVVVKLIAEEFTERYGQPFSTERTHDILAQEFIPIDVINPISGELESVGQSTKDLTTTEFTVYIEACRAFASRDLQLNIPDPDPFYKDEVFH